MTAHELAQKLLEGPDLPVEMDINGYWREVTDVTVLDTGSFPSVALS